MISVASLRPRIAAEAANCPNPVIDRALVDAARELCNAAPIWRDTIRIDPHGDNETLSLTASTDTLYNVPEAAFAAALPRAYALIEAIDQRGGQDADRPTGEMVRVIEPGVTVDDQPFRAYRLTAQRVLHVIHDPGRALIVHVAIRPVNGARTLPDAVALDYEDGLSAGALARVLRMNGQPWAHPDLASYYARAARAARNSAMHAVTRGFQQGPIRARARAFATFGSY